MARHSTRREDNKSNPWERCPPDIGRRRAFRRALTASVALVDNSLCNHYRKF
jgi:hypothetical protein